MRETVRLALERAQDIPPHETEGTPLITTLAMVEGEVLSYVEQYGASTLRELTRTLEWPPRLITMAVGGLVRERLVKATQFAFDIIVEPLEINAALPTKEEPVPEVWGG